MKTLSRWLVLAAACLALVPRVDAQGRSASNRQVVVSAAVSLTEVLQQLAPMYRVKSGQQVVLNLGASNTLARQISFGAGVDLFISADGPRIVYPAAVVRAGRNQEGGRRLLAFLQSPEAIAVFTRAGFIAPVAARN